MAGTMKALVIQKEDEAKVTDAPIPKLRPDYVKVKTSAVALNPSNLPLSCTFILTNTIQLIGSISLR